MVLMNASKKVRNLQSISNQNQGGGNKKSGIPYQVGKNSWTQIFIPNVNNSNSTNSCCTLNNRNTFFFPFASVSRPIGRSANESYWNFIH